MKIIWLGHSSFRIEIAGSVLLIDPWLNGNPMMPEDRHEEATQGATHILLSHGHFDHANDAASIAQNLDIPLIGIPELVGLLSAGTLLETVDFNKGGTVMLGDVAVTMVNAVHSSAIGSGNDRRYAGTESGYMIAGEGHTIYFSGDTDVMADMAIFHDLHQPDIGILSAGGHYTMDMKRAAYACKKFFDFRVVIPCHYRTFPLLEQDAKTLSDALPEVKVIEPEVLKAITI